MTVLEATVEIVKAALNTTTNTHLLITDDSSRASFLKGIEEIYKKILELKKES